MTPPAPHRRRLWALASTTALALVAGGLAVAANTAPAEAATGRRRQLHHHPPSARCPPAAAQLSTNPRQFVTANAPAGAGAHQRLVVVAAVQADRLRLQRAAARPPDRPTTAFADGLGFSYTTTPAISGTADRRRRVPLPVRRRTSASGSPGWTRRRSRSTAGPTGPSPRTGATAPGPCAPPSATACRSPTSRPPAATRRSRADGTPTVWSQQRRHHRLHRRRPRLRRLRPDRRELDGQRRHGSRPRLAGKGYFSVAAAAHHARAAPTPSAPTWPPPTAGTRTPTSPAPGSRTPTTRRPAR